MKNIKNLCIICLISILILILSLFFSNNLVDIKTVLVPFTKSIEKYKHDSNFENTGMYVLYVPKREKYIKDIMKKMKLNPEFVKGPDKTKLDLEQLKNDGIIAKDTKKSIGVLACYLGHLNILKKFVKSDYKYALIFEDDIKLPDNVDENYKKIKFSINNIPENTNLLYLGFYIENCKKLIKYNSIYNIPYHPSGTHSYLVDKKMAKTIIDTSYPIDTESDTKLIDTKKLYNGKEVLKYSIDKDYLSIKQNFDLQNERETSTIEWKVCM